MGLGGLHLGRQSAGIETRTSLDPLARLHPTVAVEVGTEIAMPTHPTARKASQQLAHQPNQSSTLSRGARVGRPSLLVQPTFVADAYAASVVSLGMGTREIQRASGVNTAVSTHVEVIAHPGKVPPAVCPLQIEERERPVGTGGRAVDHNQVDGSIHRAQPLFIP